MSDNTEAQERAAFEADAEPMGFDLTRQQLAVPEPWSEYRDTDTGHRWGGWLARADLAQQAATPAPAEPTCRECNGTGQIRLSQRVGECDIDEWDADCPVCDGAGTAPEHVQRCVETLKGQIGELQERAHRLVAKQMLAAPPATPAAPPAAQAGDAPGDPPFENKRLQAGQSLVHNLHCIAVNPAAAWRAFGPDWAQAVANSALDALDGRQPEPPSAEPIYQLRAPANSDGGLTDWFEVKRETFARLGGDPAYKARVLYAHPPAAQAGDALPPLPESGMSEMNPYLDLGKADPHGGKQILHWYDADQMRAYALAARGAQAEPYSLYVARSAIEAALNSTPERVSVPYAYDQPQADNDVAMIFRRAAQGQPEGGAA